MASPFKTSAVLCSFLAVTALFLSSGLWAKSSDPNNSSPKRKVDLSDDQFQSIDQANSPAPKADDTMRQWFDRVTLSGFVNAGYVKTGLNGAEPNGHFYAGERLFGADLFVDAAIDEDILAHNELFFYNQAVGLKEFFIQFKDLFHAGGLFSLKAGRFDLPYGDEYLWQNPTDNPMVLRTAEWPWGFSQGVELFGHSGALGWVLSATDGLNTPALDHDDAPGKALNARVMFDPVDWLKVTASGMDSGGNHAQSNLILDLVPITPVGSGDAPSVLGVSPSSQVSFQAWQADARIKIGDRVQLRGDYGNVFINDVDPYSRTLTYYYGEAKVDVTAELYLVGRYSAIGTFDSSKGYRFGGDYDNATDFGFDLKSLSRLGGAVGYKLTPNTVLKAEVDNDTVALIDPAVGVDPDPGNSRWTVATEVVVKF